MVAASAGLCSCTQRTCIYQGRWAIWCLCLLTGWCREEDLADRSPGYRVETGLGRQEPRLADSLAAAEPRLADSLADRSPGWQTAWQTGAQALGLLATPLPKQEVLGTAACVCVCQLGKPGRWR